MREDAEDNGDEITITNGYDEDDEASGSRIIDSVFQTQNRAADDQLFAGRPPVPASLIVLHAISAS